MLTRILEGFTSENKMAIRMIETHQIHERFSERILEKEYLMITERTFWILGGAAITPVYPYSLFWFDIFCYKTVLTNFNTLYFSKDTFSQILRINSPRIRCHWSRKRHSYEWILSNLNSYPYLCALFSVPTNIEALWRPVTEKKKKQLFQRFICNWKYPYIHMAFR